MSLLLTDDLKDRGKALEKPERCPKCGGKVVPIFYGMPISKEFVDENADKYIFAGCCIYEDSPAWGCLECKKSFGNVNVEREKEGYWDRFEDK